MIASADAGITGLVPNTKEQGKRVDFKPDEFANLIEGKGYRVSWERAAQCPCTPVNPQTDQADPTCALCDGTGWITFKPAGAVTNQDIIGSLTPLQLALVGNVGACIRAIITNIANTYEPHDYVAARMTGTHMVTTRPENKLGYYDRITNLDSVSVYSQILETPEGATLPTKYLAHDVNLLRSQDTVYVKDTDFTLDAGVITWVPGLEPAAETRVVCNYLVHPTWRIMEHPHAIRLSPVKFKTATPLTPRGDPRSLPVQGMAQLEWNVHQ